MKQSTRLLALVALLALVTVPGFAQGTSAALTGTVTSDVTAGREQHQRHTNLIIFAVIRQPAGRVNIFLPSK